MNVAMNIPIDTIYMNHASIGPTTRQVNNLLQETTSQLSRYGEAALDLDKMIATWDNVRSLTANLIGGSQDGIINSTNTASGLHIAADLMVGEYHSNGNIVITELEFTTNSYIWQQIVARYDMELRVAGFDGQHFEFEDKIDNSTVLVCISFVQFSNGYRADLKRIAQLAHDHGAKIAVDAIQGLGAVPIDVEDLDIDFMASGLYKWMLGPMGTGIAYIKPQLLEEHDSFLVGWFSDQNFEQMSHHEFHPWADARRFQQSLGPIFYAIERTVEIISELNPQKTFQHILALQDKLIANLEDSTYQLDTVLETSHRSGILRFKHPAAEQVVNKLKEEGTITSFRDNGIRISPHFHNTTEQITTLSEQMLAIDQDL